MLWPEADARASVRVRDVEVAVDFFTVRWPTDEGERPLRMALPLAKSEQERLWESRKRAAAAGDVSHQLAVAAHALHVVFERAARQGLGFARLSASKHLRDGPRTDANFLTYMNASPDQLEQRGTEMLTKGMPRLGEVLINMHFPTTAHTATQQAKAAEFLAQHAAEIVRVVGEVEGLDDVLQHSEATGKPLADTRVKVLRDRLKRLVRAAEAADVPESALFREALLLEVEAEQADGVTIRAQVEDRFLPLEARLFDLVLIGEPRPPGATTMVVPLGLSVLARSLFEICGGWLENVPPDMLIVPDLVRVLEGASPRASNVRRSVRIGIGLAIMASSWQDHDRDLARTRKTDKRRKARIQRGDLAGAACLASDPGQSGDQHGE